MKKEIHSLVRVRGSDHPDAAGFKTRCGVRLIPYASELKKYAYFREFDNASFYESEITCKKCKKKIRNRN